MNPDRIIGTAVLVETETHHWLFFLQVGRNFEGTSWGSLPMLPAGASAEGLPPLQSWFPDNRPWRYEIRGQEIHVTPSLNSGHGFWHNEGNWSVRLARALAPVASPGEHDWRGPAYVAILEQLVAVNRESDTIRLREALPDMKNFPP